MRALKPRRALMAMFRCISKDISWRRSIFMSLLMIFSSLLTLLLFNNGSRDCCIGSTGGSSLSYSRSRNCSQRYNVNKPDYAYLSRLSSRPAASALPTIFVITATHACTTQKVDLTSLCQTLSLVPSLTWIIIEDSLKKTDLVSTLLSRCMVHSVHLNVPTSEKYKPKYMWPLSAIFKTLRGVDQRNAGLRWLREHHHPKNSSGVVYFFDDDNKIDLRLFDEIRKTKEVSVFRVGFAGGVLYEGPECDGAGKVKYWHSPSAEWSLWGSSRKIPIDMAGFAVNLRLILTRPEVWMGLQVNGEGSRQGKLETDLLEHFTTRDKLECRGSNTEVMVWHTRTEQPSLKHEFHYHSDPQKVQV